MRTSLSFIKEQGFIWDKGNLDHIERHDVKDNECEQVFFNKPVLLERDEAHSKGEKRFKILGLTDKQRLIFMVFTVRENKIRIVSARDQNRKERKIISRYKEVIINEKI